MYMYMNRIFAHKIITTHVDTLTSCVVSYCIKIAPFISNTNKPEEGDARDDGVVCAL